jgi:hypothetical protein
MAFFGVSAFAQTVMPDTIDMKTAYCLGVVGKITQTLAANPLPIDSFVKNEKSRKDDLRRLKEYMLGRIQLVQLEPMLAAKLTGEGDHARLLNQSNSCTPGITESNCFSDADLVRRITSCYGAPFLPY